MQGMSMEIAAVVGFEMQKIPHGNLPRRLASDRLSYLEQNPRRNAVTGSTVWADSLPKFRA